MTRRACCNRNMLSAAVGALAQSYDHLVHRCRRAVETALDPIAAMARVAVLVAAKRRPKPSSRWWLTCAPSGFADVAVLTGPPPGLDHAVTQAA